MLHLDEKQLKAMHTRTNLRRLLDYVANSQVEKIAKMCGKGLDPNFHCQDTGGESYLYSFLFSLTSHTGSSLVHPDRSGQRSVATPVYKLSHNNISE